MNSPSKLCSDSVKYCVSEHQLVLVLVERFQTYFSKNRSRNLFRLPVVQASIETALIPAIAEVICNTDPNHVPNVRRGRPKLPADLVKPTDDTLIPHLTKVVDCALVNIWPKYSKTISRKKVRNCLIEIANFQKTLRIS